jgi:hypothetical protein
MEVKKKREVLLTGTYVMEVIAPVNVTVPFEIVVSEGDPNWERFVEQDLKYCTQYMYAFNKGYGSFNCEYFRDTLPNAKSGLDVKDIYIINGNNRIKHIPTSKNHLDVTETNKLFDKLFEQDLKAA